MIARVLVYMRMFFITHFAMLGVVPDAPRKNSLAARPKSAAAFAKYAFCEKKV